MSRRVIDDRVVEMEFDNQKFEKNVSTSLSTLDKLKAALSFGAAGKEFDSLEGSVGALGKSFNIFEEIAIGALRRIGSQAADWAAGMIKDLSGVGNAIAGFERFGDITKATGTLKGQGYALEEIETQLGRLNWFTDETSYNLSDMVDNIAKFTASGQGLEDSADAMMGIALWAATAGQDAKTASRAMYQLAQALSAGYMRKEDWKSIQNASMDTRIFRQHALDAAVALGTLKKNADGTYQSLVAAGKAGAEAFTIDQFTEKLTEGAWFTKDVMMDVYREYASGVDQIYRYTEEHGVTAAQAVEALKGEISDFAREAFLAGQQARTWGDVIDSVKDAASTGWMHIYQDLFGHYDEAVQFFTDMANRFYDIFVEPINNLGALFDRWAGANGHDNFIQGLSNIVSIIENLINRITKIFNKIAYGTTNPQKVLEAQTNGLLKYTKAFADFTGRIAETIDKSLVFRRFLRAFLTIFSMGSQIVSQFGRALKDTFAGSGTIIGSILEKLSLVVREFYYLGKRTKANDSFYKFFTGLLKPIKNLKDLVVDFVEDENGLPRLIKKWNEFKEAFHEKLDEPIKKLKNSFKDLFKTISNLWGGSFTNLTGAGVTEKIISGFDKIKNAFYSITGWDPGSFLDHVAGGIGKVTDKLNNFKTWLTTKDLEDGMTGIEKIQNKFDTVFTWIKTNVGVVWDVVKGWLTTAFHWIIENWDSIWEDIKSVGKAIWEFFKSIGQGFSSVFGEKQETDGESFLSNFVEFAKNLGTLLGTVFGYLKQLLEPLITGLNNAMANLTFEDAGKLLAGGGLGILGVSIAKFVSDLRASNVLKGLNDLLGDIGGVLDSFAHSLDAKALKEAAIGVAILVGALFILSGMPIETISSYGTALAAVILEITAALKLMNNTSMGLTAGKDGLNFTKSGKGGFLSIAFGLLVIAAALRMLAKIPEEDLKKAQTVIEGILLVVVSAMAVINKFSSGDKNINKNSVTGVKVGGPAATILAFALMILAVTAAIKIIAKEVKENTAGFVVAVILISAIMAAITVIMAKMSKMKVEKGVASTLVALSAAILIIAYAIKVLVNAGDPVEVALAGALVGGILAVFLAIIHASKGRSFKSFGDLAKGLLVLGVAVGLIAGVVYLLASTEKDLGPATIAVGVIMALLAGMVILAGSKLVKPKTADRLIKLSEGLVIFAAAVAIIAGAIYLLADLSWGDIAKGLVVLVAISAVFAGLILIANFTGDAITKLSTAFLMIGGTIALLAIGVYALIKALEILSGDTINATKIGENVDSLMAMLKEKLPRWLNDILTILLGAVATFFTAAGIALINSFLETIEMLKEDNTISKLVNGVADLIIDFCDAMSPRMGEVINAVGNLVLSILKGLNDFFVNNAEDIGKTLVEGLKALWNILITFLDTLGEEIFGAEKWKEIKDFFANLGDWLNEHIFKPISEFWDDVKEWFNGIITWIDENVIQPISDFISGIFETLSTTWENAKQGILDVVDWIDTNIIQPIIGAIQSVIDWVKEALAWLGILDAEEAGIGTSTTHEYTTPDGKTIEFGGHGGGKFGDNSENLDNKSSTGSTTTYHHPNPAGVYNYSGNGNNTSSGSTTYVTFNQTNNGISQDASDTVYRRTKGYMSRYLPDI